MLSVITWRWLWNWVEMSLVMLLSSLLLALAYWLPVWLLWNALIPPLFGGPSLSLLQAAGLLLLVRWLQVSALLGMRPPEPTPPPPAGEVRAVEPPPAPPPAYVGDRR